MKRRNFLKGFAAAVAVVSVAPMAVASASTPVFNAKIIQDRLARLDFLRRNPLTLEEAFCNSCEFTYNGRQYYYSKEKDDAVTKWEHDIIYGTQDIEAYKKAFGK